ncbi:MAG: hydrogenase maturation protease [Candidatus Aminicenantes bacterium]|nr:hydrogenase maturation protease [Candidatus Aminicenantes bacterium]
MPKTIILVLGIGNPGRRDDGLGPHFIDRLRALNLPGVAADANYQLQVEDALSVSRFKRVVFVDAARAIEAPFEMTEVEPLAEFAFTTHSLAPHTVLALSRELYRKTPTAFLLAIRGYDFGLGEGLSGRAERNLEAALGHLAEFIRPGTAATRRKRARPRTRKNL